MVPDTAAASTPAAASDAAQSSAASAPAVQGAVSADSGNAETLTALRQGGPYVLPLLLLVLAGLAVCTLLAVRNRRAEQDQLQAQANDMKQTFWSAGSLRQGAQTLEQGSPFRYIADLGLNAAENNNDKLYKKMSRRAWVGQVIQHAKELALGATEQGAPALVPIAAAAVIIGLLGAAWAVLIAPAATGTPLDALAIGEGAAMLIFGFAVGMYAMASYNNLLVRNEPIVYQIRAFSRDLQKVLTTKVEEPATDRLLARAGAR
jgi:biopolymer transport protein ExbB